MIVVGVDGGGTRSRGILVRGGETVAEADGGAAIILPGAPEQAAEAVEGLVRDLTEMAGLDLPVDALWAGLAGAGRGEPRQVVVDRLRTSGVARIVEVGTDVAAAHADAFDGRPGVLLVLGTGSVLYAVDPRGTRITVGGWGTELGDEGSGYRIGLDALQAVVQGSDGREVVTGLTATILEALGLEEPGELLDWSGTAAKADLAAVSPLVIDAAREGDVLASRIIHRALSEVRRMLEAALARSDGWTGRPRLALVGGLTRRNRLGGPVGALAQEVGYELVDRAVVPERGAARRAAELVASPPAETTSCPD
ncbi:MAG: hypothetical protein OEO23_01670 [Gemmatimonadota bacterium]|nr:hypothetical protein [Gemmatimonadota bacterium]